MPGVELGARVARERRELELQELEDVERAPLVLREELVVPRLVRRAVEHAALDQELRPLVVAVAGEERVVEVEEDEVHAHRRSSAASASRTRGSVTGRLSMSE